MRLLDTKTGLFHEIHHSLDQPYAILSHVWDSKGEKTYQDLLEIQKTSKASGGILSDARVSDKIRNACATARAHGYRSMWIDACCIDKTSSAELSEAINSMFEWYANASMCYVFLEDVIDGHDADPLNKRFRRSIWHTRGWTLQELIAPYNILFMSQQWTILGSKLTLADIVEEATGVDRDILTHKQTLDSVSVAHRMWWASGRRTTRLEDEAYCLMGIFGVHLPTIYGEGPRAFLRLQEEIFRTLPDKTLFAWELTAHGAFTSSPATRYTEKGDGAPATGRRETVDGMFAFSPRCFALSKGIKPVSRGDFATRVQQARAAVSLPFPSYTITPYGVCSQAVLFRGCKYQDGSTDGYPLNLVVLACEDTRGNLVALSLDREMHKPGSEYTVIGSAFDWQGPGSTDNSSHIYRIFSLSAEVLRSPKTSASILDTTFRMQPSQRGLADRGLFRPITVSAVPAETTYRLSVICGVPEEQGTQRPLEMKLYPWCEPLLATHALQLRRPETTSPYIVNSAAGLCFAVLAATITGEDGNAAVFHIKVENRRRTLGRIDCFVHVKMMPELDTFTHSISDQDALVTMVPTEVSPSVGGTLCEFAFGGAPLRLWVELEGPGPKDLSLLEEDGNAEVVWLGIDICAGTISAGPVPDVPNLPVEA